MGDSQYFQDSLDSEEDSPRLLEDPIQYEPPAKRLKSQHAKHGLPRLNGEHPNHKHASFHHSHTNGGESIPNGDLVAINSPDTEETQPYDIDASETDTGIKGSSVVENSCSVSVNKGFEYNNGNTYDESSNDDDDQDSKAGLNGKIDNDTCIVIEPRAEVVDLTDNDDSEPPYALNKIPSVQRDAEEIASLLNIQDVDSVYRKVNKNRMRANRLEIVTNDLLEESIETPTNERGGKNIADPVTITKEQSPEQHQSDDKDDDETFTAIFSDIDKVKCILKQKMPNLAVDPNLIYAELEANFNNPYRVDYVVNMVVKAEQKKKNEQVEDMEIDESGDRPKKVRFKTAGPDSALESQLVDEVDIIMKRFPHADENEVYSLLRERGDCEDRLEQVVDKLLEITKRETLNEMRHFVSEKKGKSRRPNSAQDDDQQKVSSEEEDLINNDTIYRDTCIISRLFPNRDKNEIYAYLEAHYDRRNRIAIVTEELLRLQEHSQFNRPDSPADVAINAAGPIDSASPNDQPRSASSATETRSSLDVSPNKDTTNHRQNTVASSNEDSHISAAGVATPQAAASIPHDKTQSRDKPLDTVDTPLDTVDKPRDTVDNPLDTVDKPLNMSDKPQSVQTNQPQLHSELRIPISNEELKPLVQLERDVETMRDVFPDCDPMWLYEQLAGRHTDDHRVENLTTEMFDTRSYPKLKDRLETEKKQKAKQRVRDKRLDIPEFLEMFPDPVTHFYNEDSTVSDSYKEHCKTFLRNEFPLAASGYINALIGQHNGHLVPVYQELAAACDEGYRLGAGRKKKSRYRSTPRDEEPMPEEPDEYFYKELLFVRNEAEIAAFIKTREARKARRLAHARENNELVECGCCYDDEVLPEDTLTCSEGDHVFCKECVRRSTEEVVGQAKIAFPCLSGDCKAEFSMAVLKKAVSPKVFSNIVRKIQEEELRKADIPDLVTCPFCSFATIMENPHDKVFKCLNAECLKESCRLCREPSHIPLRCEEVERQGETSMRTFIENRMSEAMLRTCYRCKKRFYKTEGCNKMTCTCGASMCYVCRQPVEDYSHFGGPNGCPQDTDVMELHRQEMERAAHEARDRYTSDHPDAGGTTLKHDPLQHLAPARGRRGGGNGHGLLNQPLPVMPRPPLDPGLNVFGMTRVEYSSDSTSSEESSEDYDY